MTEKITNPLIEAVDAAATKLLEKAVGGDKVDGEGTALIVEQVKAFQAVIEWVKVRHQVDPPEDNRGAASERFSKFKHEFNGAPSRRGRGRATTQTIPDDGTDGSTAALPAAGSSPALDS